MSETPLRFRPSLVLAAWGFYAVANTTQVFISMLDHGHSYPRLLLYNLLVWSLWGVISLGVIRLSLRRPLIPLSGRNLLVHALAAVFVGFAHITAWHALTVLIKPYDEMNVREFGPSFPGVLEAKFQLELLLYIVVVGLAHAAAFYRRSAHREREAALLAAALSRARLEALERQLQPHFLFNTMNAIAGLVRTERNAEALEMLVRLSELLRETLERGDGHEIPLARELELFRKYVAIEEVRFSDRLTVQVDVPDETLGARVPPFILQPVTENAVRHGLALASGKARLSLRARREGAMLRLDVFNNGPGIAAGAEEGIGLSNTRTRLEQMYGDEASLALVDAEDGVMATIRIPYRGEEGA